MSRLSVARPVAVGLLAATVLVAGCSSKKASTAASTTPSTPPASAAAPSSPAASGDLSASPQAAISGDPAAVKLYQQAMAALVNVKSVHIKGAASEGSDSFALDMSFANGKGVTGSIGVGGGTVKIIAVSGTTYIQFDSQAFAAFAGSDVPASAVSALAGKWLSVSSAEDSSSDNPFSGISDIANLKSFAQEFVPSGSVSKDSKTTKINGQDAIGLIDDGGGDPTQAGTLYVQAGGSHLPLEVVPSPNASSSAGPTTGKIDFTDYNAPVTLTAPSGAIDISQLAQLFGAPSPAAS
ncbi:MAG: hypothetical protein ACRDV3_10875 [Acidothermaceae bacterium]